MPARKIASSVSVVDARVSTAITAHHDSTGICAASKLSTTLRRPVTSASTRAKPCTSAMLPSASEARSAMRQPVGEERDTHAGRDGEHAEADPGREQPGEAGRRAVRLRRAGERIDDPAEQNGLDECRRGEAEIAGGEQPAEPAFRPEQAERADISTYQIHRLRPTHELPAP